MTAVDPGLHCMFSEAGEVMDKCTHINVLEDYAGNSWFLGLIIAYFGGGGLLFVTYLMTPSRLLSGSKT